MLFWKYRRGRGMNASPGQCLKMSGSWRVRYSLLPEAEAVGRARPGWMMG
ncbi:MAG: hypothetical protein KHX45_15785 [Clostridiales bacterium]|nr:hypothetical protein [Clostridiales bacterium]